MSRQCWGFVSALALALSTAGILRAEEAARPQLTPDQAEQRIEEILDGPLKSPLDFAETPLNTILQAIAEEYSIPVVFDVTALEAVAQSPETEVTIAIGNVTLRSALNLMLKSVSDVTYMVDNEVLLVTTEDEEQARLEVRVYPIDDLRDMLTNGPPPSRGAVSWPEYSPLIQVITTCVEPGSWQENGTGNGRIMQLRPGALVVTQTERTHSKINNFLVELRAVTRAIDQDVNARNDADPFGSAERD
jgi:hypothetical protein